MFNLNTNIKSIYLKCLKLKSSNKNISLSGNKISVSIHGSCVLRDTFEFFPELKKYCNIKLFLQNNHPISLLGNCLSDIILHEIKPSECPINGDNVWFRWFLSNSENLVIEQIKYSHPDYLLIALSECYYPLYIVQNLNHKVYLCENNKILKEDNIIDKFLLKPNVIDGFDLELDIVFEAIDKYCKNILSFMNGNRIIFLNYTPSNYYINNNKLFTFMDHEKYIKIINFLDIIYKRFQLNIPNAQIINVPNAALCDPKHKWGLFPHHFYPYVYEYIGRMIKSILLNKIDNHASILFFKEVNKLLL